MKLFTNRKLIQKITIVMVFLILFNFIVPTYSKAGVVDVIASSAETIGEILAPIINVFARFVGDGILTVIQKMFIGTDPFENDEIKIAISPGKIFSGLIYTLDIDFISNKTISSNNTSSENITQGSVEDTKWYKLYEESKDELWDKKDSYTKNPDSAKYRAWQLAWYTINPSNASGISDRMKNLSGKIGKSYSKDKMVEAVKELNMYDYKTYLGNVSETDMMEKVEDLLLDIKFDKVVKEYLEYDADNDSALYYASKPENSPAYVLHDTIATWYKIMRNIALVFLLSVLVYVGIRIMLSSTAADNTKYKKMLMDWVVALCILFVLHYLMAFAINISQLIVDAFTGKDVTVTSVDKIMYAVRDKASYNNTSGLGYTLLYLVLIFYTIYFLFYYVKRVVYIAFLTLISPLVSLTYPLDKMGDSKAQAFEMWLREYIMNVIVQPIHLLIYTTMVSSALSLAENNPIYAIVVIGAMIPAENFIKEMFGLNSKKGPKGGFLAGATTMGIMQKAANRKPPQFGHHPGEGGKGGSADKTQEKTKKPRMDGEKQAELSRAVTGSRTDRENPSVNPVSKSSNTENLAGVDNGDFSTNRDNDNKKGEEDLPKPEDIRLDDLDSQNEQNKEWDLGNDEQEMPSQDNADEQIHTYDSNEQENFSPQETGELRDNTNKFSQDDFESDANTPNNFNPNSDKEPKKKSIRKQALGATAGYYRRKIFNRKNAKKLGRGIAKAGLGAVTAGAGATIGLAAGIATGEPSKAWQYAAAGGVAGSKIGANVGDGLSNLAGGVLDIKGQYNAQKAEIIKHDKDARKAELNKQNTKYANSPEVKAAIKERYGKLSKEDMAETKKAIVRYRDNGVDDLDIIFNSYNLEKGKDYDNNDIGTTLSPDHAMYIAQMASKMDDSANSRKTVEKSMDMQFTENYKNEGMDTDTAYAQAKALRKNEMKYIDMAKGKTKQEADSIATQAEISKYVEDAKEEKAAQMQAQLNAEAQANIKNRN